MTVYNGGAYLAEALESVLAQSFRDFELLVVDDGSTDATQEVLQHYVQRDQRVRVLRLATNSGPVTASNLGLAQARGSLVARLDADDVCCPLRLSEQFARFEVDPSLVLLGTAFDYIDGAGRLIGSNHPPVENAELQAALTAYSPFCHSSVMMRCDVVRRLGGYRQVLSRYALDYDLILRLAEVGTIANLPDRLVRYRVHAGQITAQKLDQQVLSAQVYRTLARQRRSGQTEDLHCALAEVRAAPSLLRDEVVRGALFWAEMMDGYDPEQAKQLRQRAFRLAPLHPRVLRMLISQARRLFSQRCTT